MADPPDAAVNHYDYLDSGEDYASAETPSVATPNDPAWIDKDRTEDDDDQAAPSCWDDMTDDEEGDD